jgi:hypothetical protein
MAGEHTELHTLTCFYTFAGAAEIPGAMSPRQLNFIIWRLMLSILKMELASRFPAVGQNIVVVPRLLQKNCAPLP